MSAAKRLAERSGWTLSNLELQKLLYLAHMHFLGRHGEPLVEGSFEAWDYGPVHPLLYHRAKMFGASPVGNVFHSAPDIPDGSGEAAALDEVIDHFGNAGSGKLVAITHSPNGAWHRNYIPGARGVTIPDAHIAEEFRTREHAARRRAA
jgi:uncharacterized phage-associated protein